jgi:hypothetical protein
MKTKSSTVRIVGLDALDKNELEKVLGQGGVQFDRTQVPGGTYGEPGTIIAIVVITLASLKGLTAWLMKKRRQKSISLTTEVVHKDGRKEKKTIHVDVTSSDPAEIMKQLGPAFEIEPQLLQQALAS